jgi:hypothetical protein
LLFSWALFSFALLHAGPSKRSEPPAHQARLGH